VIITVPSVFDVPESQRKARIAPAIAVEFRYAGAVHYAKVEYHDAVLTVGVAQWRKSNRVFVQERCRHAGGTAYYRFWEGDNAVEIAPVEDAGAVDDRRGR
jgi:hypothetical protein